MDVIDGQMSLFFNEPEAAAGEPGTQAEEPEFEEVVIRRKKKKKGKSQSTQSPAICNQCVASVMKFVSNLLPTLPSKAHRSGI